MKTLRTIYVEAGTPHWIDLASNMRQRHGWNPVYWIAPGDVMPLIAERFPGVIVHHRIDAYHMIPPPELEAVPMLPLDTDVLRGMSEAQLIAMKMMDVMDSLDAFNFNERARFFRGRLRYWRSMLAWLRPDVAVFPFSPHCVYDYVLFVLCRSLHVQTLMFETTCNISTFYPQADFHEGNPDIVDAYAAAQAGPPPVPDSVVLSAYWQAYLTRTAGRYADAIPPYLRDQFKNFPENLAKDVFMGDQAPVKRRTGWVPRIPRLPRKWFRGF